MGASSIACVRTYFAFDRTNSCPSAETVLLTGDHNSIIVKFGRRL
jgi:hypothetical protein